MKERIWLLLSFFTLATSGFTPGSDLHGQEKGLHIYGPESVSAPMKECAEMFSRKYGIKAEVFSKSDSGWVARAKEDADVIYEETEDRLTRFIARHS